MHGVLNKLSKLLATLPNLGPKSANRITIDLAIKQKRLAQIVELLTQVKDEIKQCIICNNLTETNVCYICSNDSRDKNLICIVENINSLYAIENTNQYNGIYYILHGEIQENEENILKLINDECEKECVIAINQTIEGQSIKYYLQAFLNQYKNVNITTLSVGIPVGGDLDYIDAGTIAAAIHSRKSI